MTDLRALITQLCDELDHNRQCLLDDRRLTHPLSDKARAALAEPEPEGPTLDEIDDLCAEHSFCYEDDESLECLQLIITDALARWGRPAPQPADGEVAELVAWLRATAETLHEGSIQTPRLARAASLLERLSPPQPVPVSERLPGPEDCDTEGRCWLLTFDDEYPQWRLCLIQGAQPGGKMIWVPVDSSPGVMADSFYTSHWLPANALPQPS